MREEVIAKMAITIGAKNGAKIKILLQGEKGMGAIRV